MITKSEHDGQWTDFLTEKDRNLIINIWFKREIETQYDQDVPKLYKSLVFGRIKDKVSDTLDQESLEIIVI